jgi:hypothetical protein
MNDFNDEDISTALWILNNEEIVEVEEDYEIINKNYDKNK